jgi:hypothetical protein
MLMLGLRLELGLRLGLGLRFRPIDMRVWKGRRLEKILKLDSDLR